MLGQLTGGEASCSVLTGPDLYGKFSYSWDKVGNADTLQLKPWLDPDNTGAEEIDGISIVGLNNPEKVNTLAAFPNPTTGLVYIDAGNFHGKPVSIEVFNILGKQIFVENIVSSPGIISFDLSEAKAGVYLVKLLVDGKVYSARVLR